MRHPGWRFVLQMLGGLAVVGSLIAVVLELRQTQAALAASTYQERAHAAIEQNYALQEADELVALLARVGENMEAIDSLTEEELFRLRIFFTSVRIDRDNEYYQYQSGFLDEEYFEHQLKPSIRRTATLWRALGVGEPRPSFRAFVDEMMAADAGS